jgi:serine/threonine protein kinase
MSKSAIRKVGSELQILRERKALALAGKYPDYFVRLQCSFQRGDNLFLVMEYMAGGDCMTLLNSMPDGRLPEMVAHHIIAQVVTAVKHLHHHGVVHRDIKPDNVMVSSPTILLFICCKFISLSIRSRIAATPSWVTSAWWCPFCARYSSHSTVRAIPSRTSPVPRSNPTQSNSLPRRRRCSPQCGWRPTRTSSTTARAA